MNNKIVEENEIMDTRHKRGKSSNSANTSRIKELREKLGLTQQEFADQLNRDFQMISHIERGTKGLYLPLAIEISKQFNVSLDWLYGLSDDTKDNASDIIDKLKNVFDIDLISKKISIDLELAEFIKKLSQAYKTREKQGMPDEAFKYWVEGIKNEYNEITKDVTREKPLRIIYRIQMDDESINEDTPNN